jgi:SEC-C motif-containing protein
MAFRREIIVGAESISLCPCGSAKLFRLCCGQYLGVDESVTTRHAKTKHVKTKYAKTPEKLMRSRYTAYALGGYGEYLLMTWLPDTAQGLTVEALSEKTVSWQQLDIINKSQQGDTGTVEFKASFVNDKVNDIDIDIDSDKAELEVMHEISRFKRIDGRWFYVDGVVDSTVDTSVDPTINNDSEN